MFLSEMELMLMDDVYEEDKMILHYNCNEKGLIVTQVE